MRSFCHCIALSAFGYLFVWLQVDLMKGGQHILTLLHVPWRAISHDNDCFAMIGYQTAMQSKQTTRKAQVATVVPLDFRQYMV